MLSYLKIIFSGINILSSILLVIVLLIWLLMLLKIVPLASIENKLMPNSLSQKIKIGKYNWVAKLFHLGYVPFTMYLSIFILAFWLLTLYINYPHSVFNPTLNWSLAIIYLLPSILCSIILAYILLLPLKAQFEKTVNAEKK